MGVTTIGGGSASVVTRGEQRDLAVFAPGGLVWQPKCGDTVLVIKGGVGCQESCVAAADTGANAPKDMAPGELYLYSDGGASVYLRSDGSIEIKGPLISFPSSVMVISIFRSWSCTSSSPLNCAMKNRAHSGALLAASSKR